MKRMFGRRGCAKLNEGAIAAPAIAAATNSRRVMLFGMRRMLDRGQENVQRSTDYIDFRALLLAATKQVFRDQTFRVRKRWHPSPGCAVPFRCYYLVLANLRHLRNPWILLFFICG